MPLCNVQWRATNSWAAVGDTSSPPRNCLRVLQFVNSFCVLSIQGAAC
uniref:Uncharacterized protein n=1 Tax=Triticum urartu TaxID=4572 RepID=A0A8R7V071_TRIUA